MKLMNSKEQLLIDIMFSIGLTIHDSHKTNITRTRGDDIPNWFKGKSQEEVAQWIREQLNLCGFEVEPCGMSHGVLKKESL